MSIEIKTIEQFLEALEEVKNRIVSNTIADDFQKNHYFNLEYKSILDSPEDILEQSKKSTIKVPESQKNEIISSFKKKQDVKEIIIRITNESLKQTKSNVHTLSNEFELVKSLFKKIGLNVYSIQYPDMSDLF